MGIGAIAGIVGAVGSLASAGTGIAGSLMSKGPNLGEYSSTLNKLAQQYVTPFAGMNNAYWNLDIPSMAQQGIDFGMGQAPRVNQANMLQLQYLLSQALPGYGQMIGQMQTNVGELLAGQVPADVQNQILRNAAATSMRSGMGPSNIGNISARDLGLTSLDLTSRGYQEGSNLLQLSRNYLMPQPVNPLSLLPLNDLIQGTEWTKEAGYQANLAAYTSEANAAAARIGAPSQPLAGVGGAIQGGLSSLLKTDPNTGQSQLGSILSLFGGGGGGGQTGSGIADQFVAGLGLGGAGGAANFGY